ncbi:MAG: SGNH/GDSL hydrolase family protein [Deltaproteobacteria bacterium]|nr:SGNH/GDSL hydrolase family protein [Deltaproteobacteria bacterium]
MTTMLGAAALVAAMALGVVACTGEGSEERAPGVRSGIEEQAMESDLARDLRQVAGARILFQHMSVGSNVLEGLERLFAGREKLDLRLVDEAAARSLPDPVFAHAMGGKNGHPESKLDAFERLLGGEGGTSPDVALMKLCYVDVREDTDVRALVDRYRSVIERLRARHPRTVFVHVTTPLEVSDPGWRGLVKRVTGFEDRTARSNMRRAGYNELLRQAFPSDPIFDLAAVESTHPDGRPETFRRGGTDHPSLVPAYASDGRHLNALGQDRAARELVRTLAHALRERVGAG